MCLLLSATMGMWMRNPMWMLSPARAFRHRLIKRARTAYLIEEDLALQREVRRNLGLAEHAVLLAKDDLAMHERLLGIPAPKELKAILSEELLLWLRVRDALHDFVQRDMMPDQYLREVTQLRPVVTDLYELSLLAQTAFQRPLRLTEQRRLTLILSRRR
jgi:hypothetical protein